MPSARRASAVLVGSYGKAVHSLLADALAEVEVDLRLEARAGRFDLIICVVTRSNVRRVLAEARRLAPAAPIVAVTPMWDDECEVLVLQLGADAYWSFEWPITKLTDVIDSLLASGSRPPPN